MKRTERIVAASFVVSMVASVALVVVYLTGGRIMIEGILMGAALGGMGFGIVLWAVRLFDEPEVTEERIDFEGGEHGGFEAAFGEGEEVVTRRKMLLGTLVGAGGTLAAALAIPTLSLGPSPGDDLRQTRWARGARLVDGDGNFVRPGDLPVGGVATVFPDGNVGSGDSQALLIKVEQGLLRLEGEAAGWTPEGCVVYSKICTHAGCPVGLYRAAAHELLCPCHQSTFNVLDGAAPIFGPAARPLPQLPIEVDDEGFLVASDDFTEPVGPSFWDLTR